MEGFPRVKIEVTEKCNFNCSYCQHHKTGATLTFDLAKPHIDKLVEYYAGTKFHVNFIGGEPSLNIKVIKEIIDYLPNSCMLSITTNGSNLDAFYTLEKYRSRIDMIVSSDSNPEQDEGQRTRFVSEKAIQYFNTFKSLTISSVITSKNVVHLFDSYLYFLSLGVTSIHASCNYFTDETWSEEALLLLEKNLDNILRHQLATGDSTLCFVEQFLHDPKTKFWISSRNTFKHCTDFSILADGVLSKCIKYKYEYTTGYENLDSIRNEVFSYPERCSNCENKRICVVCYVHHSEKSNDIFTNVPVVCRYISIVNRLLNKYGEDILWQYYAKTKSKHILSQLLED